MLRLLVVEDEAVIALVASIALEDAGFHVTVAGDGQQGLEMALQTKPDVIVTDFMMPRMTGLEMIRRLLDAGFAGRIVLTTAVAEHLLPGGPHRYDAYLAKPYREADLLRAVSAGSPASQTS